jgi:hypothetical protein
MAKSNVPAKRAGGMVVTQERPAWLADPTETKGTEGLSRIVRPSFVKLIQKMSNDDLVQKYGVGAIILSPDDILLTGGGEQHAPAKFVPILYYPEWCKWSANALKGIEPMIVERTFDMKSPVAMKSQSAVTWSEPHPNHPQDPKMNYRYCEHANFIVKLTDEDLLHTDPVLISFVKTSYKTGSRLGKLALARHAPLFACQYNLSSRDQENQQGKFKVFTVENHPTEPWAPESLYNDLAKMHDDFYELLQKRQLETQYDEEATQDADFVAAGGSDNQY